MGCPACALTLVAPLCPKPNAPAGSVQQLRSSCAPLLCLLLLLLLLLSLVLLLLVLSCVLLLLVLTVLLLIVVSPLAFLLGVLSLPVPVVGSCTREFGKGQE